MLATAALFADEAFAFTQNHISSFSKKLKPVGRILELQGYYVWCNSPIYDADGKLHVFFSRWKEEKKMGGWINGSEIVHAVAYNPESDFTIVDTVLAPRKNEWDATTCHNPLIKQFNNKFYLFYMGNSNGKTNTKRIGVAISNSLYGPWQRCDKPLLDAGLEGMWDDHCTTNPAVIQNTDGKYWMFYKSWNTKEYETSTGDVRGNRKYGVAFADQPEGPYTKYNQNPIIDFSGLGNNAQLEDAFVWQQQHKIFMLGRDMGVYNHQNGIIMHSKNGLKWSSPEIAYFNAEHYHINQPPPPSYLKKYGRFERPQILFKNNKPEYLFTTSQGGKYSTSSPFIFKIQD